MKLSVNLVLLLAAFAALSARAAEWDRYQVILDRHNQYENMQKENERYASRLRR